MRVRKNFMLNQRDLEKSIYIKMKRGKYKTFISYLTQEKIRCFRLSFKMFKTYSKLLFILSQNFEDKVHFFLFKFELNIILKQL
jgi:hypothetical protein